VPNDGDAHKPRIPRQGQCHRQSMGDTIEQGHDRATGAEGAKRCKELARAAPRMGRRKTAAARRTAAPEPNGSMLDVLS
jgi:hypothetical protein